MAGQKVIWGETSVEEHGVGGLPLCTVIENGNVEPDDEWALFRLTDKGLETYQMGAEFAEGIMTLRIGGEPAVKETARFKTKEEAVGAKSELSETEKGRTLLRSVRPR